MIKRLVIGAAVVLLLGGLLLGQKVVPYASTAVQKVRASVDDLVGIETQIEAARNQLQRIEPETTRMMQQIARERVELRRLEQNMASEEARLAQQYDEIMVLRNHLETGDTMFVSAGRSFSNERVQEDLRNRFEVYRTAESTLEKMRQIYDLRQQAMDAAMEKLEETYAQKRELEVTIENLAARHRMIDVAKTASKLNFDNTQLSRSRQQIDDIAARLEVEEQMLNMTPRHVGMIPLSGEPVNEDIVDEIDNYFGKPQSDNYVAR